MAVDIMVAAGVVSCASIVAAAIAQADMTRDPGRGISAGSALGMERTATRTQATRATIIGDVTVYQAAGGGSSALPAARGGVAIVR